jgi:hypothetical protein
MGTVKALISVENDDQKAYFKKEMDYQEERLKNVLREIGYKKGYDLTSHLVGYEHKLDNAEGRLEIEEKIMGPLGVKHLGLTKMLSFAFADEILKRKLLVP